MRALRSTAAVVAAGLLAARLAACSSFSEDDGSSADAATEGAAPTTDGGDATTSDASDASDASASPDGYSAADAAGCTVVIMDEFERANANGGGWDGINEIAGTLAIDTGNPFNNADAAARSLLITIPSDGGNGAASLREEILFAKVIRYSFAVRAPLADSRVLYLNTIDLTAIQAKLHFILKGAAVSLQEQTAGPDGGIEDYPLGVDLSNWHRYELTVALDAPARVYVTRDGMEVLNRPLKYGFVPSGAVLRGGVSFVSNGPAATARMDAVNICVLAP